MAALAQSRALVGVQAAGLRPALNGAASAQRNRVGDVGSQNQFKLDFDASWEPDEFGARQAGARAAQADARASAAAPGDVQVSLAAEVAVRYVRLRGAQACLLIAQVSLASQEDTLQVTQWRVQAGLLTALETLQAELAPPLDVNRLRPPPGALSLAFPADTLRQRPDVRAAERVSPPGQRHRAHA